jgi:hypothetical protein
MTAAAIVRRPAATAAGALFGGVAALRGRRSLHPDGASYEAVVRIDGDEQYADDGGVRLFGVLPLDAPAHDARTDLEEFADAAARGGARFALALAAPFRGWRSVGIVETGAPLDPQTGERLRFNPWNTGGGIRPVGPFQGLRDAAYGASQRARLTA